MATEDERGVHMPTILPVSDLRNYTEVLKICHGGEPVFLTKNGRGKYVLLEMEEYERQKDIIESLNLQINAKTDMQ